MSETAVTGSSRAILVGVANYTDSGFTPLRAARNSLSGMHSILTDSDYGGWNPTAVTTISDPIDGGYVATRLRSLAREAEDVLLIYFVGHGKLTSDGRLLLILADTTATDPDFTGLPYDWVKAALAASSARTKIVILDCCFAGRAIETLGSTGEVADATDFQGTYTLAATRRNESAHVVGLEHQETAHTSFTNELIDLVRSGIPEGPAQLTINYLYKKLRSRLLSMGLPEPSSRGTDVAGSYVFSKNTQGVRAATPSLQVAPTDGGEGPGPHNSFAARPGPATLDTTGVTFADTVASRVIQVADLYLETHKEVLASPGSRSRYDEQDALDNLVDRAIHVLEDVDPAQSLRGFRLAFTIIADKADTAPPEERRRWLLVVLFGAEVQLRGPLQLSNSQSIGLAYRLRHVGSSFVSEQLPVHASLAFHTAARLFRQSQEHRLADRCALQAARARRQSQPPGMRRIQGKVADLMMGYGYLPSRLLAWIPVQLFLTIVVLWLLTPPNNMFQLVRDTLTNYISPLGPGDTDTVFGNAAQVVLQVESYLGLATLALYFALLLRRVWS